MNSGGKADVYSAFIVTLQLHGHELPAALSPREWFMAQHRLNPNQDRAELLRELDDSTVNFIKGLPLSQGLREVLLAMGRAVPSLRSSSSQVLQLPWF